MQSSVAPVFRFKNSQDLTEILERFAMIHCNDTDYQEFNEAWDLFYEQNNEIIEADLRRHIELGFKGDFKKKLYTSVRYYHCKRFAIGKQDTTQYEKKSHEKKSHETREKRNYKKVDDAVLDAIDEFLEKKIDITTKPADAYKQFCNDESYGDDFCQKKTFKNRFYNYVKNLNK